MRSVGQFGEETCSLPWHFWPPLLRQRDARVQCCVGGVCPNGALPHHFASFPDQVCLPTGAVYTWAAHRKCAACSGGQACTRIQRALGTPGQHLAGATGWTTARGSIWSSSPGFATCASPVARAQSTSITRTATSCTAPSPGTGVARRSRRRSASPGTAGRLNSVGDARVSGKKKKSEPGPPVTFLHKKDHHLHRRAQTR